MRYNFFHLFALFLVAEIVFGGNHAEAQSTQLSPQQQAQRERLQSIRLQNLRLNVQLSQEQQAALTPEQQETLWQLIVSYYGQQQNPRRPSHTSASPPSGIGWRLEMLESINDPILVGRHVVFSTEWLELVGNGRDGKVTREQFQAYRDRVDRLYECFERFVGCKPGREIIFIELKLPSYWRDQGRTPPGGTASSISVIINRAVSTVQRSQNMRSSNEICKTMRHEIGHRFDVFSIGPCREATADLLAYYAGEVHGFSTRSERHRRFQQLATNLRNKNIESIHPFRFERWSSIVSGFIQHANPDNAFCFYMCGLPDVVGWETFGKAIRSYHDGTYTPQKEYDTGEMRQQGSNNLMIPEFRTNARAHEFFDRLAHFHDLAQQDPQLARNIPPAGRNLTGAQALRSLPDRGRFLDRFFTVATTPITAPPQNAAGTTATVTAPPRTPSVTTQNRPAAQRTPYTPGNMGWTNPDSTDTTTNTAPSVAPARTPASPTPTVMPPSRQSVNPSATELQPETHPDGRPVRRWTNPNLL